MTKNTESTYIIVYLEIEGDLRKLNFDVYNESRFPSITNPCVYIFSKQMNYNWDHHHVGNTSDFTNTFPCRDAAEFLDKFNANRVLICESSEDDLLDIERAIREKYNIPYKYEKMRASY